VHTVGRVSARVPLDVDLEDRLLYGLTPTHLAYLIVGLLAAFTLWSTAWAPPIARGTSAIAVALAGAAAAWGRWRGRALDVWLIDIARYVIATYRIRITAPGWFRR
jgi:hypothetical protein